jgi:hypothetical protein
MGIVNILNSGMANDGICHPDGRRICDMHMAYAPKDAHNNHAKASAGAPHGGFSAYTPHQCLSLTTMAGSGF